MNSDIAQLWQAAEAQMAKRNGNAARALYESILSQMPRHAGAWLRLSTLASMQGRYRTAVAAALSAAEANPPHLALRARIFDRLLDVGESMAARQLFDAAPPGADDPTPVQAEFARLLSRLGDQPHALALAEAAYDRGLRTPPLRYLLATTRIFCGQLDQAEHDLDACLLEDPTLVQAHWTLAKVRKWTALHNHVERLQDAATRVDADGHDAPYIWFALFKELEDTGRYEEAWEALVKGCAARRKHLVYSRTDEDALFDDLIARFPRESHDHRAPAAEGPQPIFIVGMPRSGTTVLERILGAHSRVADAGELYDFPFQLRWACDIQSRQMLDERMLAAADTIDYRELGRRYLSHTQWRAGGRPFFTDKLPSNFMQIGFIHRALPGAKILHMVRDPMDTCFSNLKELFGAAYPYSYDFEDLANHHHNYSRLMEHWRRVLPGRVLDVQYASLVADPASVAREVLDFCGLPWEPQCVAIDENPAAVSTASAAQVREPIHKRNIAQWKRYEQQLAPLQRLLRADPSSEPA